QRPCERRGRKCVVDVVEPGNAEANGERAFRQLEAEGGRVEPVKLDLARAHEWSGPCVPAARTPVVPQMPDVGGRVVVRRAAANAVLRIGGVLEGRARVTYVVDAERDGPGSFASQ